MANKLKHLIDALRTIPLHSGNRVLATIIETQGSTYQKAGAKMLISKDGEWLGLLNGGCFESDLLERAGSVFASGQPVTVFYDMRSPDDVIWGLALGCNGAVRILLQLLKPEEYFYRLNKLVEALVCRKHSGLVVGTIVGHTWQKSRFLSPYLRNTLWEKGVAIDTLETALPWSQVPEASKAIPRSIVATMSKHNEKVLAFSHLSHVYRDGASIYTTYLFRRPADPDELLAHWYDMKHNASLTIQKFGGTITHQHGVGMDHAAYLPAEKGALGMDAMRQLIFANGMTLGFLSVSVELAILAVLAAVFIAAASVALSKLEQGGSVPSSDRRSCSRDI